MEEKILQQISKLMDKIDRSRESGGWFYFIYILILSYILYTISVSNLLLSILSLMLVMLILITTTQPRYEIGYPQQTSYEAFIKSKPKNWFIAITASVLIIILQILVIGFITGKNFELSHLANKMPLSQIITVGFISPIIEEHIYRRTLYSNMLLKTQGKVKALLFSIIIFTLCHLPTSPLMALQYIFGSIALYLVYILSDEDIRASTIFHIVYNIIAIL